MNHKTITNAKRSVTSSSPYAGGGNVNRGRDMTVGATRDLRALFQQTVEEGFGLFVHSRPRLTRAVSDSNVMRLIGTRHMTTSLAQAEPETEESLRKKVEVILGLEINSAEGLYKYFSEWNNCVYGGIGRDTPETAQAKEQALVRINQLFFDATLADLRVLMQYIYIQKDIRFKETLHENFIQLVGLAGQCGMGMRRDSGIFIKSLASFLVGSENEQTVAAIYLNGLGKAFAVSDDLGQKEQMSNFVQYLQSEKFQFPEVIDLSVLKTMSDLFVLPHLIESPQYMTRYLAYFERCLNSTENPETMSTIVYGLKRYFTGLVDQELCNGTRKMQSFLCEHGREIVDAIINLCDRLSGAQQRAYWNQRALLQYDLVSCELEELDSVYKSNSTNAEDRQKAVSDMLAFAEMLQLKFQDGGMTEWLVSVFESSDDTDMPSVQFAYAYVKRHMSEFIWRMRDVDNPDLLLRMSNVFRKCLSEVQLSEADKDVLREIYMGEGQVLPDAAKVLMMFDGIDLGYVSASLDDVMGTAGQCLSGESMRPRDRSKIMTRALVAMLLEPSVA